MVFTRIVIWSSEPQNLQKPPKNAILPPKTPQKWVSEVQKPPKTPQKVEKTPKNKKSAH